MIGTCSIGIVIKRYLKNGKEMNWKVSDGCQKSGILTWDRAMGYNCHRSAKAKKRSGMELGTC